MVSTKFVGGGKRPNAFRHHLLFWVLHKLFNSTVFQHSFFVLLGVYPNSPIKFFRFHLLLTLITVIPGPTSHHQSIILTYPTNPMITPVPMPYNQSIILIYPTKPNDPTSPSILSSVPLFSLIPQTQ